jgi:hypothetical protein
MSGKAVPQGVRRAPFLQTRLEARLAKDGPHGIGVEGLRGILAREKPGRGLVEEPVAAEEFEQAGRQEREALLPSLAVPDGEDQALGIDSLDAETAGFADAESGGVTGQEHGTMLRGVEGVKGHHPFLGGEDLRQSAVGTFRNWDGFNFPGSSQGDRVEKLEGGTQLPIGLVGTLVPFDVMQQELANLGLAEQLGGAVKEGGERAAVAEVVTACGRPESAEDQVLFHAVVKLSHGLAPE